MGAEECWGNVSFGVNFGESRVLLVVLFLEFGRRRLLENAIPALQRVWMRQKNLFG